MLHCTDYDWVTKAATHSGRLSELQDQPYEESSIRAENYPEHPDTIALWDRTLTTLRVLFASVYELKV